MRGGIPPATLALLAALSMLAPLRAGAQASTDPFSTCDEAFEADQESARCFFDVAGKEALWDESARRLKLHLARHPGNPWLHLYLGHVLVFGRSHEGAEKSYRDAVRTAEKSGEVEAEVVARLWLTRLLSDSGRVSEGDEVLAPAVRLAEELGDPLLLADVRIRQAWQCKYRGRDLDYAHTLLLEVESEIFPDGPADLRSRWLSAMTGVCDILGRKDEALRGYERLIALTRETGKLTAEASARYAMASLYINAELPSPNARRELRELLEKALETAVAADHAFVEARAHYELGRLRGADDGRRHLEACVEVAADLGVPGLDVLSRCQGALAVRLVEEAPDQANRMIDESLATGQDSTLLWATVYGSTDRLHVRWATLPRQEAISDSLEVLDALETLRELQGSGAGRAGLMSLLSHYYYRFSGQLLKTAGSVGEAARREDLELAFSVTERMRARVLLEALETAHAVPPSESASPFSEDLSEVLQRKAKLNRQLIRSDIEGAARERTMTELDEVELEESSLRHRLAQESPSYGSLRTTTVATLDEVERSLTENEALLSFQIGLDEGFDTGRFGGGSWLLVSTRGGTRVYRLPDRVTLDPAVDVFLGLTDLDQGTAGLVSLYHDLVAAAIEDLPAGVERLVVIPDGKLHRLAFPLLRSAEDAEPLITRYQMSVAPSATLWLRWRNLDPPTSEVAALALADPVLAAPRSESKQAASGIAETGAGLRQWAFAQGASLEPLPHAREEGRAVVRTLGGGSRLLVGEEATERFLKENDLRRYGVLHFAAHAVIDDEVPERSAILLAPGADDEDGWLQPQDIVELDLDGRVLVLASCDSAAGQVLRGEGPMSLARSFFYAGAPVVVASLWPLPDDATARLFKEFYKSLADGSSVAGALAAAQRKMLRRGAPARAWAGLVVLGNGDLAPFPEGLERPGLPPWAYLVVAGLAVALLLLFMRVRGGARRTPSSARRDDASPSP